MPMTINSNQTVLNENLMTLRTLIHEEPHDPYAVEACLSKLVHATKPEPWQGEPANMSSADTPLVKEASLAVRRWGSPDAIALHPIIMDKFRTLTLTSRLNESIAELVQADALMLTSEEVIDHMETVMTIAVDKEFPLELEQLMTLTSFAHPALTDYRTQWEEIGQQSPWDETLQWSMPEIDHSEAFLEHQSALSFEATFGGRQDVIDYHQGQMELHSTLERLL